MGKYNIQEEKGKLANGLHSDLTQEQIDRAEKYGVTVLYTDHKSLQEDWNSVMKELVEASNQKRNSQDD